MKARLRNIFLIAETLALEAWRRREIYVIVFVTTALIVGLRMIHFFDLEGLGKFYREISLKTMNVTASATIILLAARQPPREFANRTIYPLLAKPVSRLEFLLGKFIGVMAAGVFCYALFMAIFCVGSFTLDAPIHVGLFAQSIYLQILSFSILASLVFLLSMLLSADAAIALSAILFLASQILMNLMSLIYDYVSPIARVALLAIHFILPQLTLFDASAKVIHSVNVAEIDGVSHATVVWGALPASTIGALTLYAAVYTVLFLLGAYLLFRRRPFMSADAPGNVRLVAQLTFLDFIRRKDFYIVAILMSLFALFIVATRVLGIEHASTARFLASAGLTLSHFLAACLAASVFGRAFPEEFDRGTLMPLLAKPVSRGQVIEGKSLACLGVVLGGYLLFVGMTLLATPLVEGQQWSALGQVVLLQMAGLTFLGTLTLALSLYWPTLVAAPVALAWYFGAGLLLNLVRGAFEKRWSGAATPVEWLWACLPDATLMNHIECFASSSTRLGAGLFVGLFLYGLAWSLFFHFWARWRFERIRL